MSATSNALFISLLHCHRSVFTFQRSMWLISPIWPKIWCFLSAQVLGTSQNCKCELGHKNECNTDLNIDWIIPHIMLTHNIYCSLPAIYVWQSYTRLVDTRMIWEHFDHTRNTWKNKLKKKNLIYIFEFSFLFFSFKEKVFLLEMCNSFFFSLNFIRICFDWLPINGNCILQFGRKVKWHLPETKIKTLIRKDKQNEMHLIVNKID